MYKKILLNRINELSSPLHPEKADHDIRLEPLTGIQCIAFDFYGTMFISAAGDICIDENRNEGNIRFFEEALITCNFTILDKTAGKKGINEFNKYVEHHIDTMNNKGIDYPEPDVRDVCYDVLTKLHRHKIIDGSVTKKAVTNFVIEFEFRSNAIWPLPDLLSNLNRLEKKGYQLGIISNSQFYSPLSFEAIMGITINDFGFVEDLQKWSYRYGIKKPSLSFYQLFVDELPNHNLKPEEVLYVGNDLFKDVVPAQKLGMKTALFVGDKRSIRHKPNELKNECMPDIIIDELSQIMQCI